MSPFYTVGAINTMYDWIYLNTSNTSPNDWVYSKTQTIHLLIIGYTQKHKLKPENVYIETVIYLQYYCIFKTTKSN